MPQATDTIDRLLDSLQQQLAGAADFSPRGFKPAARPAAAPDAIDRALANAPRQTAVRSLADDPVVQRFRDDLANGLVRIDTVNALLNLIDQVLRMGAGR